MQYLIDTSIWVDLYEDRTGYNGERLGDYAFKLFCLLKTNQDKIIITEFIIKELETNYSIEQIRGMMRPFEDILKKISSSERERREAREISAQRDIPKGDALHAIMARDYSAVLISRDKQFRQLEDIAEHKRPEELI
ncbi:PIN domain protein [uncultured archaeon]|nr:PIN domain protein [uncultured archaeon]